MGNGFVSKGEKTGLEFVRRKFEGNGEELWWFSRASFQPCRCAATRPEAARTGGRCKSNIGGPCPAREKFSNSRNQSPARVCSETNYCRQIGVKLCRAKLPGRTKGRAPLPRHGFTREENYSDAERTVSNKGFENRLLIKNDTTARLFLSTIKLFFLLPCCIQMLGLLAWGFFFL